MENPIKLAARLYKESCYVKTIHLGDPPHKISHVAMNVSDRDGYKFISKEVFDLVLRMQANEREDTGR